MRLGVFGSYSEDKIDYSRIEKLAHLIGEERPSDMELEVHTGGALVPNVFVKALKSSYEGIRCAAWLPEQRAWKIVPEMMGYLKDLKKNYSYDSIKIRGGTFTERAFWLSSQSDVGLALHGHTGTLVESLVHYCISNELKGKRRLVVFDMGKGGAPAVLAHVLRLNGHRGKMGYLEGFLDERKKEKVFLTGNPETAAKLVYGKI